MSVSELTLDELDYVSGGSGGKDKDKDKDKDFCPPGIAKKDEEELKGNQDKFDCDDCK